MIRPFGTRLTKVWSAFDTSVRPVASITAGTATTGTFAAGRGLVPPEAGAFGAPGEELEDPLHPAATMPMVTVSEIQVQRRDLRAEARVMDAELTPVVARHAPVTYASRLAELEQMLEVLARSRSGYGPEVRSRCFVGDPVALTQALHPDGLRSPRRSVSRPAHRASRSMPVRVVVFDGTPRR
jgi:hypothetical protein